MAQGVAIAIAGTANRCADCGDGSRRYRITAATIAGIVAGVSSAGVTVAVMVAGVACAGMAKGVTVTAMATGVVI